MPEIVISDAAVIPDWVIDHNSYRRWATSDSYPERGWFAYLGSRLWADLSMERASHNLIKTAIAAVLTAWCQRHSLGRLYGDRMLLSNVETGLSTEPDGIFVSWKALKEGRVRELGGEPNNATELVGTPDMVLEVVCPTSRRKDTDELLNLYWQAQIPEYWLVNPLQEPLRFEIRKYSVRGYRAVRAVQGWRKSASLGGEFRLVQSRDPLGQPAFRLRVR